MRCSRQPRAACGDPHWRRFEARLAMVVSRLSARGEESAKIKNSECCRACFLPRVTQYATHVRHTSRYHRAAAHAPAHVALLRTRSAQPSTTRGDPHDTEHACCAAWKHVRMVAQARYQARVSLPTCPKTKGVKTNTWSGGPNRDDK